MTKFKIILSIIISLILITLIVFFTKATIMKKSTISNFTGTSNHDVMINFINVGDGDSIVINIDNKVFMIDTGRKSAVPQIYKALSNMNIEKIDALFLTHTHDDHIKGVEGICSKYKIDHLYTSDISEDIEKFNDISKENNLSYSTLKFKDTIQIVDGVKFEVLGPYILNTNDDNDNSLVLRLNVNNKTILFSGDMQKNESENLILNGVDFKSDILKVGNHGNKDATSKEFAKSANPSFSVISTDTKLDTNSANKKVLKTLDPSKILITQDFKCGIMFTISKSGEIEFTDPKIENKPSKIIISDVNIEKQTITLLNQGDTTDISGYYLYTKNKSHTILLPKNTILNSNSSITIGSKNSNADIKWTKKELWSDNDSGSLYDSFSNELSTFTK